MMNDRILLADDGTRIAYGVAGSGPALVLTNGLTTTTTFWEYVRPLWLQHHTVVTWDLPGHGQSGPAQTDESARFQNLPKLVAAVMDAAGVERAAQIGWSTGSQVVLEAYRQFPERCASLVMLFGAAGRVLSTTRLPLAGPVIERLARATPPAAFELTYRLLARAMRAPGSITLGRMLSLVGAHARPADMQRVIEHIGMVDPRTLRVMLLSAEEHSAHAVLSQLSVPLLILSGDRDPFAPSELVGVPLQQAAPGSELLRLPMGTHTALLEEPKLIAETVERFVTRSFAT
jgi:pimeloyl-ACP methyl ester carboxylesterase